MSKIINLIKEKSVYSIMLLLFGCLTILMITIFIKNGTYSADTGTKVNISCPTTASANAEFECTVSLHVEGDAIDGISGNYSFTKGVSYVSFTPSTTSCSDDKCMDAFASTSNGIVFVNIKGVTGDVTLGKIKVKSTASGSVSVSLIKLEISNMTDNVSTLADAIGKVTISGGSSSTGQIVVDTTNHIISRIPAQMTYEEVITAAKITDETTVKTIDGIVIEKTSVAKTKELIVVNDGNPPTTYIVSVLGDVDGDGEVKINDVGLAYRHLRGKADPTLTEAQLQGGNIIVDESDKPININDISRLYKFVRKKIPTLEVE